MAMCLCLSKQVLQIHLYISLQDHVFHLLVSEERLLFSVPASEVYDMTVYLT